MGLDRFYDKKEDYRNKAVTGFSARSTGCDRCSVELNNEKEVVRESIKSIVTILRACEYFGIDIATLVEKAKEARRDELKEVK